MEGRVLQSVAPPPRATHAPQVIVPQAELLQPVPPTLATQPGAQRRQLLAQRQLAAVLVLVAFCAYGYFVQFPGWNQYSRLALMMSIVHRGTLTIDAYTDLTGDKARYGDHDYSDKAIGTALLGTPVYGLVAWLIGGEPFALQEGPRYPLYLVTLVIVALPSAFMCAALFSVLFSICGPRWAFGLTVLYAFGTLAFPFSMVLFGHQGAATFAFLAFALLIRVRQGATAASLPLLAGGSAALAVLFDYPALLIAGALFLYLASLRRWRALVAFSLGAVPGALVLAAYNAALFGSPLRFGYQYLSAPEFAPMRRGLFGITLPQVSALGEILIGPRGLLAGSPFLILAPLGWWLMWRERSWRAEGVLCATVCLATLLWNAGYYLPLGGETPGPRFLVPALPFLFVPLAFLVRLPALYARLCALVLATLGSWSVAFFFIVSATNPLAPAALANPLGDYWLARWGREELLVNAATLRFGWEGYQSLLPLVVILLLAVETALTFLSDPEGGWRGWRRYRLGLLFLVAVVIVMPLNPLDIGAIPAFFRPN